MSEKDYVEATTGDVSVERGQSAQVVKKLERG